MGQRVCVYWDNSLLDCACWEPGPQTSRRGLWARISDLNIRAAKKPIGDLDLEGPVRGFWDQPNRSLSPTNQCIYVDSQTQVFLIWGSLAALIWEGSIVEKHKFHVDLKHAFYYLGDPWLA